MRQRSPHPRRFRQGGRTRVNFTDCQNHACLIKEDGECQSVWVGRTTKPMRVSIETALVIVEELAHFIAHARLRALEESCV